MPLFYAFSKDFPPPNRLKTGAFEPIKADLTGSGLFTRQ